jgi:hypothetical protein
MRPSTRYLSLSAITVLVLGVLLVASHDAVLSERSSPAVLSFYFVGNAVLWTVLFVVGLFRYGISALWLVLVMPVAFFHVGLLVLPMLFFAGP